MESGKGRVKHRKFEWSDERIARLKALWAEGHSASAIARKLAITRNSVMGKIFRLGLCNRDPSKGAHFSPRHHGFR